jgi:hypothetical protein
MDNGSAVGSVMAQGEDFIVKAVHLRLGGNPALSTTFDPLSLSYSLVWDETFLRYPNQRWGITGLVKPDGKIILEKLATGWSTINEDNDDSVNEENHYHGYYRYGDEVIFRYRVQAAEILDRPGALSITGTPVFTRTLQFANGSPGFQLSHFLLPKEATRLEAVIPDDLAGVAYKTAAGVMGLVFSRLTESMGSRYGMGKQVPWLSKYLRGKLVPRSPSTHGMRIWKPRSQPAQFANIDLAFPRNCSAADRVDGLKLLR